MDTQISSPSPPPPTPSDRQGQLLLTQAHPIQVTYFKKFRVADYQKKKTFERLEKEGANLMPDERK